MSAAAFSPQAYYVSHVRDWGGQWRVNHEVVFTLPEQLGIDLCREMKPVEVTRDDGAAPGTYMPRTMDSHLLAGDERTCEVTMSMCAPTDTVPIVRLGDLVRLYESDSKEKEEDMAEPPPPTDEKAGIVTALEETRERYRRAHDRLLSIKDRLSSGHAQDHRTLVRELSEAMSESRQAELSLDRISQFAAAAGVNIPWEPWLPDQTRARPDERDQKRYGVRFVEATPLLDETGSVCGLCLTGVDRPRKGLADQPRWRYQASVRFDEFGECMTALRRERIEQARTEEGMWARARSAEEIEERVADRMALIDRLLLVETIERLIEEKGEATGEYHPQNAATI